MHSEALVKQILAPRQKILIGPLKRPLLALVRLLLSSRMAMRSDKPGLDTVLNSSGLHVLTGVRTAVPKADLGHFDSTAVHR